MTGQRLSPYFSAGVVFAKSKTFKDDHLWTEIWTEGVVGVGVDYRFNSRLSLLVQHTQPNLFFEHLLRLICLGNRLVDESGV